MTFNNSDEKVIRRIVKEEVKDQFTQFNDTMDLKLQNLKSDIFDRIDPILKEVGTSREERPLLENRVEALEEIHPKGKHVLTS